MLAANREACKRHRQTWVRSTFESLTNTAQRAGLNSRCAVDLGGTRSWESSAGWWSQGNRWCSESRAWELRRTEQLQRVRERTVIPHCPHLSCRSELLMRQKLLPSPQIGLQEFLIFKYPVPNPTNGAAWLSALLQTLNKRVSDDLILTIDPSISTLCSTSSCRAVHAPR